MQNLIIDGQLFQTNAWYRGMGKYAQQLLRQLSEQAADEWSVSIVFNDAIECDPARFEVLKVLCPNISQLHVTLPVASSTNREADEYREKLSSFIQENFAGGNNSFLISSLFSFDFYAEYPDDCRKLLLFYDLTPLLFWRDLGGYFPPELYMERFEQILDADLIFSISQTTKDDLIDTFGLADDRIINVNGGYIEISDTAVRPKDLDIPAKYVLFPTGDLPHKNNDMTIKGFEAYCQSSREEVRLLITSYFSDESKRRLQELSDHITFTGNVSDEELEWLYEHAEAILFGSKYEGLGLPILDAVSCDKPVITSRISVFEEMSKGAFYYYDIDSPSQLSERLGEALEKTDYPKKSGHYKAILERYTWRRTGKAFLDGMGKIPDPIGPTGRHSKESLAIVSLHPGIPGQIGRLGEVLFRRLSQSYDLSYYFDGNGYNYKEIERPTFLDFVGCEVYDIGRFTLASYAGFDQVLYLIDSAALPSRVAQRACIMPGIICEQTLATAKDNDAMFMDIARANAYAVVGVRADDHEDAYERIRDGLATTGAAKKDSKLYQKEAIIKRGGSNKSIMKKLSAIDL